MAFTSNKPFNLYFLTFFTKVSYMRLFLKAKNLPVSYTDPNHHLNLNSSHFPLFQPPAIEDGFNFSKDTKPKYTQKQLEYEITLA